LANTSLETYMQNSKWFDLEHPETDRGCFDCHIYNPETLNGLHLSHIFNVAKDYGTCTFDVKFLTIFDFKNLLL